MIGAKHAELGHGLCGFREPGGPGFFQSGLKNVAMAGLNEAGADGEFLLQGGFVIQTVAAVVQVTVGVTHGSFLLWGIWRFVMTRQLCDDGGRSAPLEPALLGFAPALAPRGSGDFGGRRQILADMVKVAKHVVLISEDRVALKSDPLGPVGHHMDLTFEPPSDIAGAMSPASSGLINGLEGRRINGFGSRSRHV